MTPASTNAGTVAVAMSGGVDSSLTAILLRKQGYDVIGVTMWVWDCKMHGGTIARETACCSPEGINDARAVCQSHDIPHYVLDLRDAFQHDVIADFISEYLSGRTPNPCVLCNQKMKWEALFQKTKQLGATLLATGHYARIEQDTHNSRYLLKRGIDDRKDQSYFLWPLTQEQLQQTLFPLGAMTKAETRRLARVHKVKVADKNESQEICFIPDHDYRRFINDMWGSWELKMTDGQEKAPIGPGPIKDAAGVTIGMHQGYPFYTTGQRKGLGIAFSKPLYVTKIDPSSNTVFVGSEEDLWQKALIAADLNWISIERLEKPLPCQAKIRYRHTPAAGTIYPDEDNKAILRFDEPQRAITPGQSIVFYDGETVIGGGIIDLAIDDVHCP